MITQSITETELAGLEADPAVVEQAIFLHGKFAAEENFRSFVEQAWHVLEPATPLLGGIHLDAICDHLQAVAEGRIKDLLINVPPGHAKSLLCCVFFPAWVWIEHPEKRWLFSSYKADLAVRDSVKCRVLIQSGWYQDRWSDRFQLTDDQNEKKRFANDRTGYREITSVGTGTGSRADIVVCDDPLSADQAQSDAERKTANDWWCQTMTKRTRHRRLLPLLEDRDWLTPSETAVSLGCSVATLHRMRRGLIAGVAPLPCSQYGRRFVFRRASIAQWRDVKREKAGIMIPPQPNPYVTLNQPTEVAVARTDRKRARRRRPLPPLEVRDWMTANETALALGCSVAMVHRLRRGLIAGVEPLPCSQYGRKFIFRKASIARWRDDNEQSKVA